MIRMDKRSTRPDLNGIEFPRIDGLSRLFLILYKKIVFSNKRDASCKIIV